MFTNGKTQTESLREGDVPPDCSAARGEPAAGPTSSARLASTFCHPCEVVSPAQFERSAH